MILFGLGTLPMMLSLSLTGGFLGFKAQRFLRKASPLFAVALALLLIQRGIVSSQEKCCKQEQVSAVVKK
jgi:sulfite exporter TauE/SafE